MGEQLEFSNEVSSGTHELIKNNIMKLITTEFEGDKTITLEAQTAKLLYQDYPSLLVADLKVPGLISHKSIAQKKLFFNDMLARQIKEIEEILKPSKLSAYCQSLKKNNLTMGVVSIFSGSSGTGKTEAVYQIARKTGRDIFMVDLSQTKSKWFGESEKLVKGIFNSYSVLLKNRVIEPILFINEADGLFSKRREIIGQSSSVDQSLNTIQNILLQALESFEGILIATTNLSCNIDKAFERRFTFKIDFQKPDKLVRKRIWKSKLPELSEKNADLLAERYEITGGDIDVQVRQALLQKVLKRESNIFEVLNEICSKGHSFDARTKLGFR
jgi:SpoVK/Ycf46/Vps4 family AAA+-type ATPase